MRYRSFWKWLPPVFLFLSLGSAYFLTLAPGLSWANDGADGGDLITAAATGGVAHPSGYPTYLYLARLFQIIPIGSIAYRTNLLSAVSMALASVMVYCLVISFVSPAREDMWIIGWIPAFAFGLSPLAWSQAVITEVYALHTFFIAVILYLLPLRILSLARWKHLDKMRGLLSGLAMGNHVTIIFLIPLVLFTDVISINKLEPMVSDDCPSRLRMFLRCACRINWKALATRLCWFVIGVSIYLTLIIRANTNPPINWGNPVTLHGLYWLVTGQLYENRLFGMPIEFYLSRITDWAGILFNQLGFAGLALGLVGLFSHRNTPTRLYIVTGWVIISFAVFSIGYNSYDSKVYLIPVILAFSIWVGLGVAALVARSSRHTGWPGTIVGVLLLTYFACRALIVLPQVDAAHDSRAEQFGQMVLASAPADAVLVTSEDKDTFTLWYYLYALQQRPDIAVVSQGLLPFDWYRNTLHSIYPGLVIPEYSNLPPFEALREANPNHPVCNTFVLETGIMYCPP